MESQKSRSTPSDGLGENIPKTRALHGRTSGPTRRSTKGKWTPEEDEILRKAVVRFKGKNWKKIAECFKDRSDVQCLHRWQKVLNPELIKGPWSKEEDEMIVELVNQYGPKKWSTIAHHMPGRIGKQCRERWHNHLNPSINKKAWTQEEELVLIRSHQIYGNRWAELTKLLPGRTDNAIKNHWNSSVKKKLDSYLKSGLLGQFPVLTEVENPNQPKVATPSRMQSIEDDSGLNGTQGEEISECSQDSNFAGSFKPERETVDFVLDRRQDYCPYKNSVSRNEHNSCPPLCEDSYYPSLDDVSISFPAISQHEGCSSQYMTETFLNDAGDSSNSGTQFSTDVMPDKLSLGLGQDSSNLHTDCVVVNRGDDVSVPYHTSVGLLDASSSGGYSVGDSDKMHMLISDEECCRVLFSDSMHEGSFQSGDYTNINNMITFFGNALGFGQQSNAHISDKGKMTASQPSFPPISDEGHDAFEHSPCVDSIVDFGMEEHQDVAKNALKSVSSNNIGCRSDKQICLQLDKVSNDHANQENAGALCYEPPRFPSLDIPFVSCDLIQSNSEMQQEFSPLGIRQFMMTSLSPLTPFRLWDSPSRDDSPDSILRNAAITFTNTPSILKKRNRDLLSPLSDRRIDKKLETGMTSTLSRDFSRMDVMFDEHENLETNLCSSSSMQQKYCEVYTDDRGNHEHEVRDGEEKNEHATSDENLSGSDGSGSQDTIAGRPVSIEDEKMVRVKSQADEDVQQLPGVLLEHDMNDMLLYSPDQVGIKAEKTLEAASHSIRGKELETESAAGKRLQHAASSSALLENLRECNNARTDSGFESLNIFAGTPFKRSIESPSAWKSPWFINTFLPNPSMEDISFFLSPGDRSYDAIGLMKQISDQTAAAYANAQEVLINETPTTKEKAKSSHDDQSPNQENSHPVDQLRNHSLLASNVLKERRTLDFSECGTTREIIESGKSSAVSFSSLSSHLLKNCR